MSDTTKILRMSFETDRTDPDDNVRRSVSIRNPVDNPDPNTVKSTMEQIANNGVFGASGHALETILGAVVVETTRTDIDLPE